MQKHRSSLGNAATLIKAKMQRSLLRKLLQKSLPETSWATLALGLSFFPLFYFIGKMSFGGHHVPRGWCKVGFCSRFDPQILLSVSRRGFVGKNLEFTAQNWNFQVKTYHNHPELRIGTADAAWQWCQGQG